MNWVWFFIQQNKFSVFQKIFYFPETMQNYCIYCYLNWIEIIDSSSAHLSRILGFFMKITSVAAFTTSLGKEIHLLICWILQLFLRVVSSTCVRDHAASCLRRWINCSLLLHNYHSVFCMPHKDHWTGPLSEGCLILTVARVKQLSYADCNKSISFL